MAQYKILFGFEQEETEQKIVNTIRNAGNDVTYTERTTKESIKEYLLNERDCGYAVLREGMGPEMFSAEELAELTDTRDINIVVIIDRSHLGTQFMQIIYAAGITGAIMVGNKAGASPVLISHLLTNKRSRKKAKFYYGIDTGHICIDILTYDSFVYYYTRLLNDNYGLNVIDRYLSIVKDLSTKQAADFTRRLPVNVRKELSLYDEFYSVMDAMRKQGIQVKVVKPRNVKRGLTDKNFSDALSGTNKEKTVLADKNANKSNTVVIEEDDNLIQNIEDNVFFNDDSTDSSKSTPVLEKKATKPKETSNVQTKEIKKKSHAIKWKYVIFSLVLGAVLLLFWVFLITFVFA